jgi:hypothetical protein
MPAGRGPAAEGCEPRQQPRLHQRARAQQNGDPDAQNRGRQAEDGEAALARCGRGVRGRRGSAEGQPVGDGERPILKSGSRVVLRVNRDNVEFECYWVSGRSGESEF